MELQKLMQMSGPNGKSPCPYCSVKGFWSACGRHYYYPLRLPPDKESLDRPTAYDPHNLPQRTTLKQLIYHVCAAGDDNLYKESGVAGLSIFMELDTVLWPESFCINTMHLVLENLLALLYRLWTGTFHKDDEGANTTKPDYVLSKVVWENIGDEMDTAKSTIPTAFGRTPRSIFRHSAGFKAVEWWNFLAFFAIPSLDERLPAQYVQNLMLIA